MIRGYFLHLREGGADFHAVSWDAAGECWVNLQGESVPAHLKLEAWGPD